MTSPDWPNKPGRDLFEDSASIKQTTPDDNKKAPTAYAVEASILVELGGVEPPSESTLPLVLHA